jgi:type IV fimbrial biogenesis protein FimT
MRLSHNAKGFSLIEVIVVMVILAIISALAAPSFSEWIEKYRVKSASRQLVTDLQLMKMKSISDKVQHRIRFINASNQYMLERYDASAPAWVQFDIVRDIASSTNPYFAKGVSFTQGLNGNNITFSPSGSANPFGTVIFTTGDQTRNVVVSMTGRIRIE